MDKTKQFQSRDVANVRKVREEARKMAEAAVRRKLSQQKPVTDDDDNASTSSTLYGTTDDRAMSVVNLLTSDDDHQAEESVLPNTLRTAEKRRCKLQETSGKTKLIKMPTLSMDSDAKLRAKYGLSQKLPKVLINKYKARSQQNPFNFEPPIPSISYPYLTREHLLARHVRPPVPENTPVLGVDKPKPKREKSDKKTGTGI